MNKILLAAILTASFTLLTACGGGSSDGDGSSSTGGGTGGSGNEIAGISPFVTLTSTGSSSFSSALVSASFSSTISSGFEGDIQARVVTDGDSSSFEMTLLGGASSMNVVDIQRTQGIEVNCDGEEGRGTLTTDFSSGKQVLSGTDGSQTISCTIEFDSPLPTTIFDDSSIQSLLLDLGNAVETSNTCPDDSDDLFENDDQSVSCDISSVTNIVVTDDNNGTHKISIKQDANFSN